MRIAVVAPPFIQVPPVTYGGTELFIAHLASGLHTRGHDVIVYANAYHDFDSLRPAVHAKNVVTGRNCDMKMDLDRFVITVRATGEDITRSAATYGRSCLTRGAMVGGDSEARRRAPEDVKTFLKKVFGL